MNNNGTQLPKNKINIDDWLDSILPITNATTFKNQCLVLEQNLFCTDDKHGSKQMTFFEAIQSAFFGDTEMLSEFLTNPTWSIALTKQKLEVISWFLNNPQNYRKTQLNKFNRMRSIAIDSSWRILRLGLSQTKAIDEACYALVEYHTISKDRKEQLVESYRRQFYRELKHNKDIAAIFNNNSFK